MKNVSSTTLRISTAKHGRVGAIVKGRHESRHGHVRFAEPAHAAELWLHVDARAELSAARAAHGNVRSLVRLLDALHAGAARSSHGPAKLFASLMGTARAV